ncbi:MAG: ribosome silencing factor [Candidatus Cloacimonas sp.]|nr:ribosome silencing factor [Candidatus Cloacimonadota bacterium]
MTELNTTVEKVVEWIVEKKGEDIKYIDVRNKSSFTDFFVICNGNGDIHTKAIANHIIDMAREHKIKMLGKEGLDKGRWILLDLVDVVVHIFDTPQREFYRLEDLWDKIPERTNE